MKPDSDLQQRVMQALVADPHVDETAIGVTAHHGVVTLFGIVRSSAERDGTEAVVRRVPGVNDVANEIELKVGDANPSDPEIAEAVRNALAASPSVDQAQIATTVAGHGHVTLRGTVATVAERDAAEAVAQRVEGVELVTNAIVVAQPATTATQLRTAIAHALERHAARDVDRIDVAVHGDTVVLTGTIGSPTEQRAVIGAVRGTPGIKRIDDRLLVASTGGTPRSP